MFLDLRIKRLDTAWIRRLEARPIFTVKMYALEDQINLIETRSTALLAQSRAMGHPGSLLYLVHLGTTHMATSYQLPTITSMFSYLGGTTCSPRLVQGTEDSACRTWAAHTASAGVPGLQTLHLIGYGGKEWWRNTWRIYLGSPGKLFQRRMEMGSGDAET